MVTPYKNIAKDALINWNNKTEEEANNMIENLSIDELEKSVGAKPTIFSAIKSIARHANLTEEEQVGFGVAIFTGPLNHEIFNVVLEKLSSITNDDILDILSDIHDDWVIRSADERIFNKKVSRNQLRQYAPLDLIGWNEVISDLLFLKPIMEAIGITIDEKSLKDAYHNRVISYMEEKNINDDEDLFNLVNSGRKYYSVLPEDLEERLLPMSSDVVSQIINNWKEKDKETYKIFIAFQKDNSAGIKK